MITRTEYCGNCRHWHHEAYEPDPKDGVARHGECRRYPPVEIMQQSDGIHCRRLFGITEYDMWCGEWREMP